MSLDCKVCGGTGFIYTPISVPVCCGNPNTYGECCGNPVGGEDWEVEPCENCYIESLSVPHEPSKPNDKE